MTVPTSFGGVLTALVTPFLPQGDAIDWKAFDAFVEWQISEGVSGLVACGTTGETPTLTETEYLEVIRRTVQIAGRRVPVWAGAGSFSTKKSIESARAVLEAGADAAMVVMPYYNRPPQSGLVEHVSAVARAVKGSIVLYNIPSRTGVDLSAESTAQLCEQNANIVALKDATGNVLRCQELVRRLGDRLAIFCGDDALSLPMLACGGRGVISTASNLLPRAVSSFCQSFMQGDWQKARRAHLALLPVYESLFAEPNPIPVKAALAAQGRMSDTVRLPLLPASPETRAHVGAALAFYEANK